MSIGWADSLLAGAAGVAEFSEQEQARRQKRLDKAQDMKNQMRLHQAKSQFAVKMNQFTANQKSMKFLEGVEAGGFDEQLALHRSQGASLKDANILATRGIASGNRLTRTKQMEMPQFMVEHMDTISPRAVSPIGEWVRKYTGADEVEQFDEVPKFPETGEAAGESLATASPFAPQPDFQSPLGSGETPDKPTYTVVERPSLTEPGRFDTFQIAKDPLTGKVMYETFMKTRDGESLNARQTADIKAGGTVDKGRAAKLPGSGEVTSFIKNQFGDKFAVLDRQLSGFFQDDASRGKITNAVSTDYLTTKNNLVNKLTNKDDVVSMLPGIEKRSQGLAYVRNVEPKLIAEMLLEDIEDESSIDTLDFTIFEGLTSAQIKPIIRQIGSKARSTKAKFMLRKLKLYQAQSLRGET